MNECLALESIFKACEMELKIETCELYKCDVCGRQFQLKSSLKTHLLRHAPSVPYDCDVCGRVFKEKVDFRKHMESHSNGCTNVSSYWNEYMSTSINDFVKCDGTFEVEPSRTNFETFTVKYPKEIHITPSELKEESPFTPSKLKEESETSSIYDDSVSTFTSVYDGMKCNVCSQVLSSKRDLEAHSLQHESQEKSLMCAVCKDEIPSEDLLQSHVNQDIYQCKKCDTNDKGHHDLEVHEEVHNKEIECVVNEKNATLKERVVKPKSSLVQQKCSLCESKFKNKKALREHVHEEHLENVECKICGEKVRKHNLLKHELTHTSKRDLHPLSSIPKKVRKKTEVKIQCHICGNLYEKSYLKIHLRIHAGEKIFSCEHCEMNFVSRTNLRGHMKVHTSRVKSYECSVCNGKFLTKKGLIIHTRRHTGEKPYKCSVCNKAFGTSWILKNHLRLHNLEDAFSCDICGKKYGLKKSLYAHYGGNVHSKEELQNLDSSILNSISRKYECKVCGKNCSEKTVLTLHMRTHTGEKPFTCLQCEKAFRQEYLLKAHIKMHAGDLPFECEVCKKRFVFRSQAKQHALRHSGKKQYMCTICGKAFFFKGNLKFHIQRHALKKNYTCNTCGREFTEKRKCNAHQKSCSVGIVVNSRISESDSLESSNMIEDYGTVDHVSLKIEASQHKDPNGNENIPLDFEILEVVQNADHF